jgi:hypothetical protein
LLGAAPVVGVAPCVFDRRDKLSLIEKGLLMNDLDYCPNLSITYRGIGCFAGYKCDVISNIEGYLCFGSLEELIREGGLDRKVEELDKK